MTEPGAGDDEARRRADGQVTGVVTAQLPSGLYQVELAGARRITAHAGSGSDRNYVRLLVGDRVVVALMPRDPQRGRILRKA